MLDLGIILNILKEKKSFVKKSDGKKFIYEQCDFKRIKFDLKSISSEKNTPFVSKIILSLFCILIQ